MCNRVIAGRYHFPKPSSRKQRPPMWVRWAVYEDRSRTKTNPGEHRPKFVTRRGAIGVPTNTSHPDPYNNIIEIRIRRPLTILERRILISVVDTQVGRNSLHGATSHREEALEKKKLALRASASIRKNVPSTPATLLTFDDDQQNTPPCPCLSVLQIDETKLQNLIAAHAVAMAWPQWEMEEGEAGRSGAKRGGWSRRDGLLCPAATVG